MKNRATWIFAAVVALTLGTLWLMLREGPPPTPAAVVPALSAVVPMNAPTSGAAAGRAPSASTAPSEANTAATAAVATGPAPSVVTPPTSAPTTGPAKAGTAGLPVVQPGGRGAGVAVPDGTTAVVSGGHVTLKDDAASRAVLEKEIAEMREAVKDVTFPPRPAPTKQPATATGTMPTTPKP